MNFRTYDDWKLRSDRDDDWWNEPEPEPEEEEPDMEDVAKEIENALKTDFPNAKLAHKPFPANGEPKLAATTVGQDIEALKAKLNLIARGIEMLKGQL